MNKTVYMISTMFYPSIGGVENHIYFISKYLVNNGYEVKIIKPSIGEETKVSLLDNIEVHTVGIGTKDEKVKYDKYKERSKGSNLGFLYGYLRKNYFNKFYKEVYSYIENNIKNGNNNEVIIHQHDFISSIRLSKRLSKKYNIIFTNHTGEFLFLKKLPFSNTIIKQLTKHFSYIIAPSDELAAFNGIRDKNGDFIARMDADDYSYPTRFEKQVEYLNENKDISLCATGVVIMNEFGEELYRSNIYGTSSSKAEKSLLYRNVFPHGSWMFRREILDVINQYNDVNQAEDYDLLFRLISRMKKISVIDEYLFKYRLRENGISFNNLFKQKVTMLCISGWLNLSGTWYYLNKDGSMKTGWLNDKNKWYYLKPVNGEMAIGWANDNGTWYYTDSSGVMKTGWLNLSGIWYYLNSNGSMKTGWLNDKNKWYYLKPENGAMVTGWVDDNGSWYYTDASGVMKTGWLKENNYWYYLKSNGVMATGWNNINNKVYYFYNSGKMAVGDLYLDNKWYLFDESGYRKTGWIKKGDNWNYYDNKSGELLTNSWLDEGTKRYWLKADGAMAIGEVVINGVLNKFDNNGYFIGTDIVDKSKELYIKVLDLGNAEAIYIELPNGDDVLIDGGEIYNTKKVIDFLNEQDLDEGDGIKDIEYVINTHPHSDHTAGLIGVFQNFKVNNLYYPHDVEMKYYEGFEGSLDEINGHRVNCMNYCYQFYIEMLAEAKKQRTVIYDTIPGNYVDELGILKFVHPNKTYKQDNLDRVDGNINSYDYCLFNNDSAVILIDYNELQMLLASDIEKEAEEDMINMGLVKPNSIDILKVGHHGYDTSTTKRFVDYLNPSLAIIARSSNNYMNTNAFNNLITNRTIIKETWKSNGVEIIATINGWNVY